MTDAMFDPIADLYDRFTSLTQATYRGWIERSLPERRRPCGGPGMRIRSFPRPAATPVTRSARRRRVTTHDRPGWPRRPSARLEVADLWDVTPRWFTGCAAISGGAAWRRTHTALSRNDFHRHYAAAFPGAVFADTLDPSVCAVAGWPSALSALARQRPSQPA